MNDIIVLAEASRSPNLIISNFLHYNHRQCKARVVYKIAFDFTKLNSCKFKNVLAHRLTSMHVSCHLFKLLLPFKTNYNT